MSRRTDAPPLTADRDLDRVAATLRARFDREAIASASRPEPVPNLSPSDGSSLEVPNTLEVPSLPPVAAREVPLIRPGAAASARAPTRSKRARSPRPSPRSRATRARRPRGWRRSPERSSSNSGTPEMSTNRRHAATPWTRARGARRWRGTFSNTPSMWLRERPSRPSMRDRSFSIADATSRSLRSLRASFEPVVLAASAAYAARARAIRPGARDPTRRRAKRGVRPTRSSARPLSTGSSRGTCSR